jgi:hypothetical protein
MGLALAIAAVALGAVPPVARADASSDIPGIPLPGSIVTGILGGVVYDVVYRLDLAAGSVVVASLTGSPDTDFDLYLFDASATTVVDNVGVVARSTGPSSTESLAYATVAGGRFYLDLNGASETQGAYTLTVQTAVDRTPPVVTIGLAGGRPAINSSAVDVSLHAVDDLSPISDMAFSADGATFGPWQPFAPAASVILSPGDGQRSVWVRVRNAAGLESAVAVASISVDTRAPAVLAISPLPDSRVGSLRPAFRVTFDEPVSAASWAASGLLVQRADGTLVTGTATVDASGLVATFIPLADLLAGTACLVTLGAVTDVAGNPVPAMPSWTVVAMIPASLAARANATTVARGAAVEISGTYRGSIPPPATLALEARVSADTAFGPAGTVAVAADGSFRVTVSPAATTTFRLTAPETFAVAAAQADLRVAVRRDVRLLASGAAGGTSRAGRTVVVRATVGPTAAGLTVTLRLYRWDPTARTWRLVSTRARVTPASGAVTTGWTPTSPGSYRWRAAVNGTAAFATNFSSWVPWSITR